MRPLFIHEIYESCKFVGRYQDLYTANNTRYQLCIYRLHDTNLLNSPLTLTKPIQNSLNPSSTVSLSFVILLSRVYKYLTVRDDNQMNVPLSQHWEVQEDHWHLCCWRIYKVTQMSDQETLLSFPPSLDRPWRVDDFVLSVSLGRKSLLLREKDTRQSEYFSVTFKKLKRTCRLLHEQISQMWLH